jgi:hypothetical protein
MTKNQKDYQLHLLELISIIKDKSTYLRTIDKNSIAFNQNHFEGMADTYFFILDAIITYIKCNEGLTLEEFGLENYDPNEIFSYKPLE